MISSSLNSSQLISMKFDWISSHAIGNHIFPGCSFSKCGSRSTTFRHLFWQRFNVLLICRTNGMLGEMLRRPAQFSFGELRSGTVSCILDDVCTKTNAAWAEVCWSGEILGNIGDRAQIGVRSADRLVPYVILWDVQSIVDDNCSYCRKLTPLL